MSEELKGCPFCGEIPNVWYPIMKTVYQIICSNEYCLVKPLGRHHSMKEAAIAAWNHRAGDGE